jgi:hypothetical protein
MEHFDHTNGVLRAVYIDADLDDFIRKMAMQLKKSANDVFCHLLEIGMKQNALDSTK